MLTLLTTPRQFYTALPRDYWHVREPIGANFMPDALGGYYIDMRGKAGEYRGPTRDGIPLRNQNNEGLQLLPVTFTQLALGHYEFWLVNNGRRHLDRFLECADWLVEHHEPCPGKRDGWQYWFDHGRLGIKAPFISAMGQGQGISVLVRAYDVTKHDKYLTTAQRALEPFAYEVTEGGVTARLADGSVYYEEYPSQPYSHVLNGHIFALWGLYDYAIFRQDGHVRRMFEQGADTLRKFLPRYDVGYWSRYCLFPHPLPNVASPFYHDLHIHQLRALFALTEIGEFRDYADRWERQFDRWRNFTRAVYGKVRFKVWIKARKKNLSRLPFIVEPAWHTAGK
jgi:hypothetical protein